jgi:hypothetical protein
LEGERTGIAMNGARPEDPSKRYEYRIDAIEDFVDVTYFAESVDLSKPTFVTFAPRYRLSRDKGEVVKGQILTFPSHLIRKITNYVRT